MHSTHAAALPLPDEAFAGVFDQLRQQRWREVDL
jgi:hypothetical protein